MIAQREPEADSQVLFNGRRRVPTWVTILACTALMPWGGDVLRGFAFILTLGVIVGTYSSIYIASPFALLWEQIFGHRAREKRHTAKAAPPPAPTRSTRAASGRR